MNKSTTIREVEQVLFKASHGRRRFPIKDHHFVMITLGDAVIFSVDEKHDDWVKEHLKDIEREKFVIKKTLDRFIKRQSTQMKS